MNKTTYNLSISAGDASANVNSSNPGDLLRLLQLAGQNPGEKNYNLNVSSSSQDDAAPGSLSQSQSLSLQTNDPNHIARLLQLSGQAATAAQAEPSVQTIGPKPCGCPGPCDCGAEEPKSCGCDGPCDCEMSCDDPGAMMAEDQADYDAGMREPTEDMDEFGFPTFSKAGTAGEPERLTKASGGSNPLRAQEDDLTETFHRKIQSAWQKFVSEGEKFGNEDGVSSPLSADKRQEFEKDPFANKEPDTDGSASAMTHIERPHIPR